MESAFHKRQILDANIDYHTRLAPNYNSEQPQYRPENLSRVRRTIENLALEAGNQCLCDLGCGTGFILDLAYDLFDQMFGVDLTAAMMDQVKERANLTLVRSNTESLPFPDQSFNVMTGYGFLHHLYDLRPTLNEAHRCLRPGGLFYADSDPNAHFWKALSNLNPSEVLNDIVRRERNGIDTETQRTIENYGFSTEEAETIELAEFQKMKLGGIEAQELTVMLKQIGFREVSVKPEWFLGQGQVLHQISEEAANQIEHYLRDIWPLSQHLFKYLAVVAKK